MDMDNTMVQISLDGDQLVLFVPWTWNWSDNTALTIRLDKEPDMLREIIVRSYDLGREAGLDEDKHDIYQKGHDAGWEAATEEYYGRRYDEGFDAGVLVGKEEGYEDAKYEFYDSRYDEGKNDGYVDGYQDAKFEYEKIIQDMEKEMRHEQRYG